MSRALKTTYCRCHTAYSSRVAPLRCPFCFSRTKANIKDIFLSCKRLIDRKLNRKRQKWGAECDGSRPLPSHQTSEKWGNSFFRKMGKINLLFTNVYFGIFKGCTMPNIDGELEHGEAVAQKVFTELGGHFALFFCIRREIEKHQDPHYSVFGISVSH